mgnify:CR=1 FL=1
MIHMANNLVRDQLFGKTMRKSYAKYEEILEMPNMLKIQKDSYEWFLKEGLREVFKDVGSITDFSGKLELSFLDFSMDEKPKYTILVGVCKQSVEGSRSYYGIDLAGPVANDIMCYLYANDHSLHATIEEPAVPYSPTSIKAGNSSDVAVVSHRLGAHHTNASEGKAWSRADIDVGGNSTVIGLEFEAGTVPNVVGMGLSDALYLLESVGLEVTHSGAGKVTSQSIKAGVEIGDAETIHLTLKP